MTLPTFSSKSPVRSSAKSPCASSEASHDRAHILIEEAGHYISEVALRVQRDQP